MLSAAGVRIAQIVREEAAGDLDANAVSLAEAVGGGAPEIDRYSWALSGSIVLSCSGLNAPTLLRVPAAAPAARHRTTAPPGRREHIDQPNHPVRVASGVAAKSFAVIGPITVKVLR